LVINTSDTCTGISFREHVWDQESIIDGDGGPSILPRAILTSQSLKTNWKKGLGAKRGGHGQSG
jgi:hypothetical protein